MLFSRLCSQSHTFLRLDHLWQVSNEGWESRGVECVDDIGGEGTDDIQSLGAFPLIGLADAAHGKLTDIE